MSDAQQVFRQKVESAIAEMLVTGKSVAVADYQESRHPVGQPHVIHPAYVSEAGALGYMVFAVRILLQKGFSEETGDYVLVSKKTELKPVEIRSVVPDYEVDS